MLNPCWWGCKLEQSFWDTIWHRCSKDLKNYPSFWSDNYTFGSLAKENGLKTERFLQRLLLQALFVIAKNGNKFKVQK